MKNKQIQLRAIEMVYDCDFWDDGEYDFENEVVPALDELIKKIKENCLK